MSDVNNQFRSFFDLYDLTPSARLHVVRKVLDVLDEVGAEDALVARAEACAQICARAMNRTYDWRQRKSLAAQSKSTSTELDARLDRALSNTLKFLEVAGDLPEGHPQQGAAAKVIEDLFPEGVFPITSLPYEDQLGAVEIVLQRLDEDYQDEVELLHMGPHVERLQQAFDAFEEALTYLDGNPLTYDMVLAARTEAAEAYHKLVASLLVAYIDNDATRARVLRPVITQNDWTARYYRRRGTSPEVDPDSGEPIDGDVPTPVDGDVNDDSPEPEPIVEPIASE
jgi:tetratricopeptide (TPR) repeat protein